MMRADDVVVREAGDNGVTDGRRAALSCAHSPAPVGSFARIDDLPLFASLSPPPPPEPPAPPAEDGLGEMLDGLDPDAMTPREALEALYRLKRERAAKA